MSISDSSAPPARQSDEVYRSTENFYQSNPSIAKNKDKKLLIITSSGGGGLIQAANAKEQEARANNPQISIIRRDVLRDWLGQRLGEYCANRWNQAQIKGDVADQAFCAWAQLSISEYIFWPNIFLHTLYILFKEDVDEIIDTQCLGTSAILAALRIYNKRKKKQVRLQKVLVDLPTKKATHFFHPIKKLTEKSRRLLQLIAIPPLLEEGETAEEFWQSTCNLSEKEVHCGDVYVRQAFKKFQNKPRTHESMNVKVRVKSDEELQLIQKSFKRGPIQSKIHGREVEFQIQARDRMVTVLLGSNPANQATFNYMRNFIPIANDVKVPTHLFVFCADHKIGGQSLFSTVVEYVEKIKDYPKNLSIIPFSFQNEDVIAPLFFRSDATCTRSGGQTAMELMCVSRGEIWIHSETKKNPNRELTNEELLKGIPGWESESAVYLQKIRGAKIITPDTFSSCALNLLRADGKQDRSNPLLVSGA